MIWLVLLVLLLCSGTISGSETALFSLTGKELQEFCRAKSPHLQRVYRIMRHQHRVLMTILIANTAVNTAIFSFSYVAISHLPDHGPALAAAIGGGVLLAVILFGEMLPKIVALASARNLAPLAAAMVSALEVVLGPIRWTLSTLVVVPLIRLLSPAGKSSEGVSTDELQLLVEHSAREGHIGSTENEMLQAVVGMEGISVREVMTPRVDVESVSIGDTPAELREAARQTRRRVFPVRGRDLDDIRGMVYVRELLLYPNSRLPALVRPADFLPEQANLAQVIRRFREESGHVAIVVDEYGGTAGLVTNEDVVEWIVGELPTSDLVPPRPETEQIDENTYRVSGDLGVATWSDRFGVEEIDRRVNTVGGLILSKLGRTPQVGDRVRIRNLTLTVEAIQRHRIERVLLHRDGRRPGGEVAP